MIKKKEMKVYLKVTKDKYELPLAIADSPSELAEMVGTTSNAITSAICHNQKGYKRVIIDYDERDIFI